jgi:hypothetical protein
MHVRTLCGAHVHVYSNGSITSFACNIYTESCGKELIRQTVQVRGPRNVIMYFMIHYMALFYIVYTWYVYCM